MRRSIISFENLYKAAIVSILFITCAFAGQTGKISGYVIDNETGEPVIGANVIVEGTFFGAAADIDGYYYINNIPPGSYKVSVSAVGYRKSIVENVVVRIDQTTSLDIDLYSESIELNEEVVVTAQRPLITRDLTSTKATVSSKDIEMMPVDNLDKVINLQAGVMDGHFRGGRSNEVTYLVDGIPVTDVFSGENSLEVENSSVRELEVISGTFNAEYGQALSGIVNIVTKEGSNEYEGLVSAYAGSYFSDNTDIFQEIDAVKPESIKDLTFSFSGPTQILSNLNFFVTGRYFENEGYYYGKRVYNISDTDPYEPTGDDENIAMNPFTKYTVNGKLSYAIPDWKFSYTVFWGDEERRDYNHDFKWAPDGVQTHYNEDLIHNFQISYFPTQSTATSLKLSLNRYMFKGYVFEDEVDSRYTDPFAGLATTDYTFRHGGTERDRYRRTTDSYIGLWYLESQVSKEHKVKLGVEGQYHNIFNHWKQLVNLKEGQIDDNGDPIFEIGYRQLHTEGNQLYEKNPYQISAYIQDKMEYDIMIINAGVRLDYFNPNTTMPTDFRNPSRVNPNPNFPGGGESVDADAKYQLSPRLGVSFPITDNGAIYFSYGHFFQIPNYETLYTNDKYIIDQQDLNTIVGNPDLDAQKTVKYELGLQQVLFPNLSLDFTVYYSDIRNLLGVEIVNTYEGFKYARYINKDYGNIKGFILTLDKRFADYFGLKVDYTFQIAEGNSSDPLAVYNDSRADPPVESEKSVVPLDWDQRSTLNISATVGVPGDWTVGLLFQYGSGTPYTEDIQISNGVRFENGGRKPSFVNFDLKADKVFDVFGAEIRTFLLVYNVFDIKNETNVYSTTGRANSDLNTKYAGDVYGLNTIDEYIANPTFYSAPRQIRLGLSFGF